MHGVYFTNFTPRSKTIHEFEFLRIQDYNTSVLPATSFFRTKEGFLALFVSVACPIYFLIVPANETSVQRARAKTENESITLQSERGVFKENHVEEASQSAETSTPFCLTLPVLMYHHIEPIPDAEKEGHAQLTVSPDMFESHITELQSDGYKIISITEAVTALIQNLNPGKAAVITIDDGYKDNYTYALPIAKKHNIPITFFISTGLLENPGYMTWNDLQSAKDSGLVTILNHTWSHFSLPAGDISESREEVKTAEQTLTEHIGTIQKIFAYPYGSFDNKSIEILQSEEYIAAFTTQVSSKLCDNQMLTLPRVRIGNAPISYFGL